MPQSIILRHYNSQNMFYLLLEQSFQKLSLYNIITTLKIQKRYKWKTYVSLNRLK